MSGAVPPLSCVNILAAYPSVGMATSSALTLGVRLLKSSVNCLKRSISPGLPQVDHLMLVTGPPACAGACAPPAAVVGCAAGCPPPADCPVPLPLPRQAARAIPVMPAAVRLMNLRRLTNVGLSSELMPHSS